MFKAYKNKIIFGVVAVLVLGAAFFASGNGNNKDVDKPKIPVTSITSITDDKDAQIENEAQTLENEIIENEAQKIKEQKTEENKREEQKIHDISHTAETVPQQIEEEKVPEQNTEDVKTETQAVDAETDPKEMTCTISVNCSTILNNTDSFNTEKLELVPSDGVILGEITATFYEGESVFNVLQREMKKNKIHMEFTSVPAYNSAYIEGIANIYELDCGGLSGWMYRVNGEFPNFGASKYELKNGDKIEWLYTCDLGADIGGGDSAGNNSK